jgi:response regulator NasT
LRHAESGVKSYRVLLVEGGVPDAGDRLREAGCEVLERLGRHEDVLAAVARTRPDILVLDLPAPPPALFRQLRRLQGETPLPVVIFSQDDTQDSIEAAVAAGVSAYVVDALRPGRLPAILETAAVRFRHQQALLGELDRTRGQLEDRKCIERAKGILMARRGLSEEAAYSLMRSTAMAQNRKLVEIAAGLITAVEML